MPVLIVILDSIAALLGTLASSAAWLYIRAMAIRVIDWMARSNLKVWVTNLVTQILALAIAGQEDVQEAVVNWILDETGLYFETLDKEGALKAVGGLVAQKLNAKYGTTFTNMYPIEQVVEQLKQQLITEAINSINGHVDSASLKILNEVQADAMVQQIINAYKQSHNIPILAKLTLLPTTTKRQKNKDRQAAWKIGKPRLNVWRSDDNGAIYDAFNAKIAAYNDARNLYRHKLGIKHEYQRKLAYWSARPIDASFTIEKKDAKITYYNNKIEESELPLQLALDAFNLAKTI